MNIVIDASSLLLPGAGVKNHMHYWVASLLEATRDDGDFITTYPPGIAISGIPDHQKPYGPFHLPMVHLCNIRGSPLLRFLLSGADVFHASQHVAQLPKHGKVTATVHDLSCWTVAEDHTTANIAATRRYAENILKKCDGVIAVSKHTRKDAMEILGIPGDRIRVIYHGIEEGFFQVTPEETAKASATYGLEAPYLLFVGRTSSLPEVVGDGGLLVAPDSLEELREAMQRLVTHPTLARDLGIRGKERAERFRWPVCARESLKFFHDVAGG